MNEQATNPAYKEILRLEKMLIEAKIPHCIERAGDGWRIAYPMDGEKRVCSIVEHIGTYGYRHDRLEIMGLLNANERKGDTVVGWLTAENVFDRIKRDLERRKKRREKVES
jgi:hypothetical protein